MSINYVKSSWRKWYATYNESNLIKVYPTPQPESSCARNAVDFGEARGLVAKQLRAADTLQKR